MMYTSKGNQIFRNNIYWCDAGQYTAKSLVIILNSNNELLEALRKMSKTNLTGLKALQETLQEMGDLAYSTNSTRAYKKSAKWLREEIDLIEKLEKSTP